MAPFKLPIDAYVLAVPLTYGLVTFFGMISRVPTRDPESTTLSFYDDEKHATQVADRYNNDIRGLFDMRIRNKQFGVFNNEVTVTK